MRMTVTAERLTHGADWRMLSGAEQFCEVLRILTRERLSDDLSRGRAYPGQGLQVAGPDQSGKLAIGQPCHDLGRSPEGSDAVSGSARALQLEGDLPKGPSRFHNVRYTGTMRVCGGLEPAYIHCTAISRLSPTSARPASTRT